MPCINCCGLRPSEKKLHPQAQPAIRLVASSDTLKGYEQVTKGVTLEGAPASPQHHSAGVMILTMGLFTMLVSQHPTSTQHAGHTLAKPASVRILSLPSCRKIFLCNCTQLNNPSCRSIFGTSSSFCRSPKSCYQAGAEPCTSGAD